MINKRLKIRPVVQETWAFEVCLNQIKILPLNMGKKELLNIENLSISFLNGKDKIEVVHNINFQLFENEILGIVGESGSGKSVSSLAIMGLLPRKVSEINSGSITFKEANLLDLNQKELQGIRGKEIAMIFQEPMSSLNPSMRCGAQVMEMLKTHFNLTTNMICFIFINVL